VTLIRAVAPRALAQSTALNPTLFGSNNNNAEEMQTAKVLKTKIFKYIETLTAKLFLNLL